MNDVNFDEMSAVQGGNLSCEEAFGMFAAFGLSIVFTGGAGIAGAAAVGAYMVYQGC